MTHDTHDHSVAVTFALLCLMASDVEQIGVLVAPSPVYHVQMAMATTIVKLKVTIKIVIMAIEVVVRVVIV
jgi:hypothetical protein